MRLYCEVELCLAASTFGRGGILSENFKDGKVTVHSAKNTTKFGAIVGRSANHADQINLGVAEVVDPQQGLARGSDAVEEEGRRCGVVIAEPTMPKAVWV